MFKDFAINSSAILEPLSQNDNLKGIGFIRLASMQDTKGNETTEPVIMTFYTKENTSDINFKNFRSHLYIDESNFYKVADDYWIHPGVYTKIKTDAVGTLAFASYGDSEGFEKMSTIYK
ncbi:hypothetical protein [Terribacillus halophilus]